MRGSLPRQGASVPADNPPRSSLRGDVRSSAVARIDEILRGGTTVSFEFFPPRDEEAEARLESTIHALEPLHPSYVSVTYGAGGSTRERTHDLVVAINRDTSMTAMAHLCCAAHSRAELAEIL